MTKTLLRRAPLLLLLPLLLVACSSGPSDSDIEAAVKQSLEEFVPVRLSGNLGGGREAVLREIRIIEIGSAQGSGTNKYWPVKVYVKGRCKTRILGPKEFEGQSVYRLSVDGFGKWTASTDIF